MSIAPIWQLHGTAIHLIQAGNAWEPGFGSVPDAVPLRPALATMCGIAWVICHSLADDLLSNAHEPRMAPGGFL